MADATNDAAGSADDALMDPIDTSAASPPFRRTERGETLARCAEVAAGQLGLISRDQALAAGLTPAGIQHRLTSGEWLRRRPRVYAYAAAEGCWKQDLLAVCLWLGPGAAASHRAAAALWQLHPEVQPVEVTIDRRVRPAEGVAIHFTRKWIPADRTRLAGIPVTTPTRTLIDLGATCGPDEVEIALDAALRRRLTTLRSLTWHHSRIRARGRNGAGVMTDLLRRRSSSAPTESEFETRLLQLLRRAQLPLPCPQYVVADGCGFVARLDFAYPAAKVAVEADGFAFHSLEVDWHRDRSRYNHLAALGWTIVHVTWSNLTRHPDRVVRDVRAVLQPRLVN